MFSVNARSYAFFLKKGLVGLIWMLWWCPCPWICRWHPTLSFFRPDDTLSHDHALAVVEACISDFRDWFIHNRLLNSNAKTDGCSHQLSKISVDSIAVGDSTIQVFPIRAAPDLTLRCQCQSIIARFAVKHSMASTKFGILGSSSVLRLQNSCPCIRLFSLGPLQFFSLWCPQLPIWSSSESTNRRC